MGAKGFDKIDDVCKKYLNSKQGQDVSVSWLRHIIATEIGSQPRTIDAYLHQMSDFKIIKESPKPNMIRILKRPE